MYLSIREDLVDMNTMGHHEAMEFKTEDAAMRHSVISAIFEKDDSRSPFCMHRLISVERERVPEGLGWNINK